MGDFPSSDALLEDLCGGARQSMARNFDIFTYIWDPGTAILTVLLFLLRKTSEGNVNLGIGEPLDG